MNTQANLSSYSLLPRSTPHMNHYVVHQQTRSNGAIWQDSVLLSFWLFDFFIPAWFVHVLGEQSQISWGYSQFYLYSNIRIHF